MKRRWVWGLVFALASLATSVFMWGFVVDDALISVRYARHLAMGLGYRFNAGGPSTDGVTPLPWPFLLYPLAHGSAAAVLVRVKILGVALQAVAAALVGARIAALEVRPAPKVVAVVLWLACLPLAAWGPAGMETPLVTALCSACVLCMHRPRLAAAFAGLAVAFRPELGPWAVTVGCGLAIAQRPPRRAVIAVSGLLAVAPFALCAVVRLVAFGRAAPLAVLAKPSDLAHGWIYVQAALLAAGMPITLLAPFALVRVSPQAKVLGIGFVVHALAVVAAGGDWMPYARLFVPILPTLLIVMVEAARASRPSLFWARSALAAAVALYVFVMAGPAGRHVMRDREDLVKRASPLLAASKKIATVDIGWVSEASEGHIVDLAGLTDPDFAALPGGHTSKRVDASMLLDRNVDAIVLWVKPLTTYDASDYQHASYGHQVGARLGSDPVLQSHFMGRATFPLGDTGAGYVLLVPGISAVPTPER